MIYWTNSNFADRIRGTNKPSSATATGWHKWHKEAKTAHPVRYWIAESLLSGVQQFIQSPGNVFNSIKFYISNRWVSKTHALTSSPAQIKRGQWCDLTERILLCLFNELVDFVEIETASHNCVWDDEMSKKYPRTWKDMLPWNTWRSPESGIAHLEWAASLVGEQGTCATKLIGKPTSQALAAKEVLDLYYWWKEEYPNRVDPSDLSGWSAYCEQRRKENNDIIFTLFSDEKTPAERAQVRKILQLEEKIKKQYNNEEEAMLIRLIKIRHYLWT